MRSQEEKRVYFNRRFLTVLGAIEFTNFEGEISEDTGLSLTAEVEFDGAHLLQLAEKKRAYLRAATQEPVSDDEVIDEIAADVADAMDIIFNKVGYDAPEEAVYKKINHSQWRKTKSIDYYSQYSDLLRELTDGDDSVPSIPGLYRDFLVAAAESDEHELPPEGVVEDILKEHIDSVRAEEKSRTAVSKLKQELEASGMYAQAAASTAKSVEEYLKSDAQLREEELINEN